MPPQPLSTEKWYSIWSGTRRSKGYLPRTLQCRVLSLFIILDVVVIVSLLTLSIISLNRDGFVTVRQDPVGQFASDWLVWRLVPSLSFTLLSQGWKSISDAAGKLQPYIELSRPLGAPASRTVYLEYNQWGPKKAMVAFRNQHYVTSLALSLSTTFALAHSLSSSLFQARDVPISQPITVSFNTTFQANDAIALGIHADWRPIFFSSAAVNIYGGDPLPWTSAEHAFRPFYFSTKDLANRGGNITANTTAWSGYLNCSVLSPTTDYSISFKGTQVRVSGRDRGCDIQQQFDVVTPPHGITRQVYFKASTQHDCDYKAWYSRLVFTYARYDKENTPVTATANTSAAAAEPTAPPLVDQTVVSCVPAYHETTGQLRIALRIPDGRPVYQSFLPSTDPPRDLCDGKSCMLGLETSLLQPASLNPNEPWSTSDFGSIVLYNAASRRQAHGYNGIDSGLARRSLPAVYSGDVGLSGEELRSAAEDVFNTVFLTAVASYGLVPVTTIGLGSGTADIMTTRLFVTTWAAMVLLALLVGLLVAAIWLLVYVDRHPTRLRGPLEGLISYAGLLAESSLIDLAKTIVHEAGTDGEFKACAEKFVSKSSMWRLGDGDRPGHLPVLQRIDEVKPPSNGESITGQLGGDHSRPLTLQDSGTAVAQDAANVERAIPVPHAKADYYVHSLQRPATI